MADKDLDRTDIIIEGNQASWEINTTGAINGLYTGTFKFRCYLTPTQRLAASREHRALLGENPSLATEHDENLSFSLTQLKYRILQAPPFWTSSLQVSGMAGGIPDENVIDEILQAAVSAELKYRRQLTEKKNTAIEKARKAAEKLLTEQQEEETSDEDQGKS